MKIRAFNRATTPESLTQTDLPLDFPKARFVAEFVKVRPRLDAYEQSLAIIQRSLQCIDRESNFSQPLVDDSHAPPGYIAMPGNALQFAEHFPGFGGGAGLGISMASQR